MFHSFFNRIVFVVLIAVGFSCKQADVNQEYTFAISRGVNVSHWLSQSSRRGAERDTFILEKDFAFIASLGYDHVRLPVDEEHFWDEEGNRDEAAFQLLHDAIAWAEKYKLKVIVDLHIVRSHHFNHDERPLWTDPAEQEKFIGLWKMLSEELKAYPLETVAYELLNEAVADDPEDWNSLLGRTIAMLRKSEPRRKIVVGANMWQSVHAFADLRIPEGDRHLILSFHFYEPMPITHYQAPWVSWLKDYKGPVKYPGVPIEEAFLEDMDEVSRDMIMPHNYFFDKQVMDSLVQKPVVFARRHDLPLYCGEWGCRPLVPEESRMQWYRDVREIFEEQGIAWANWDYKGGFGIVSRETGEPYTELIEVLLGEKE